MLTQLQVLIVGFGDLGRFTASLLLQAGYDVTGLSRTAKQHDNVRMLQGDVTDTSLLKQLENFSPDYILYCVSADGQTDAQYKAQYVDGLRNICEAQRHNTELKGLLFVSSTRVYGQQEDELIDEHVVAKPKDFGGRRLLEAEQLLSTQSFQAVILRLSGIYGPGRNRMLKLAKQPENWPNTNAWTNRIHRNDAAGFIVHLINKLKKQQQVEPLYIVTDDLPCRFYTVLESIAAMYKITVPDTPVAAIGGKRLCNHALRATGFNLQYPNYKVGYKAIVSTG